MSSSTDYIRMNVTLPEDLVMVLKSTLPPRGISKFLAEAAKEKMVLSERDKALRDLLATPATFTKITDSAKYVRSLRRLDEKRAKSFKI